MKTFLRFALICFFIWLLIVLMPALLAVALPLVVGIGIIGILLFLVFAPRAGSTIGAHTPGNEKSAHSVGAGRAEPETGNGGSSNNEDSPEYIPGEKI